MGYPSGPQAIPPRLSPPAIYLDYPQALGVPPAITSRLFPWALLPACLPGLSSQGITPAISRAITAGYPPGFPPWQILQAIPWNIPLG